MSEQTVTINGTVYNTKTGMPLPKSTFPHVIASRVHPSREVHHHLQRSHTLNRRVVQRLAPRVTESPKILKPVATVATSKPVSAAPIIAKFAPHPKPAHHGPKIMDIGPSVHPIARKAHDKVAVAGAHGHHSTPPKPSSILKQQVVSEALKKAPSHQATHKQVKTVPKKSTRIIGIASASLALLLLGGYFTYLNMPSLSLRVAAAQAGIDASYPSYRPDGYGRGVVGYQNNEVSVKFASNAGPQNFTLTQQKTTWDSTAVKENYVKKNWGDNIDIVTERGLTIYRKDGNAVWVNSGILYTINGNAPLSPSQIRSIATSM